MHGQGLPYPTLAMYGMELYKVLDQIGLNSWYALRSNCRMYVSMTCTMFDELHPLYFDLLDQ